MRVHLSRAQAFNGLAVLLSATAVLVATCLSFLFLAVSRPEKPLKDDPLAKVTAELATMRREAVERAKRNGETYSPGQRIAEIEAQLKTLQKASRNDLTRPTIAALERELDRMAGQRRAAWTPLEAKVSRLERLAQGSLGLNIIFAVTLLAARAQQAPAGAEGSAEPSSHVNPHKRGDVSTATLLEVADRAPTSRRTFQPLRHLYS
jgi:hypothetical protein